MNKIHHIFLLMFFCSVNNIYADTTFTQYSFNNGYLFDGLDKFLVEDFFVNYRVDLGLTTDDVMTEIDSDNDEEENTDIRYQQYYKGYKVEGGQYLLHADKGIVLSAFGTLIQGLNIDVSNPISESSALSTAIYYTQNSYNITKYAWEDESMEFAIQCLTEDVNTTYYPVGELVMAKNTNPEFIADNYRLAWKFAITAIEPSHHSLYIYVDAINGNVINDFSSWDHANYYGAQGTTTYHGIRITRTAKCTFFTCNKFKLKSDAGFGTVNKNILKNGNIPGVGAMEPEDSDNLWHESQHASPFTAHWAIGETYKYYNDIHGRWGTDGNGKMTGIVMGYDPNDALGPGKYAAYDRKGLNSGNVEFIGVAQDQNGVSPVSLDIMAHEFTHGVINRTSQLNLYNSAIEAAALNEGFSDIFGLLTEYNTGVSHNWKIGEYVPFSNPGVRDFINPGSSTPPQPHTYGGTHWDFNNYTKHINAGVLTKWFSLLANGGTHNNYTVTGIGMAKAERIAYITMAWWLWHNVHYPNVRDQSILVAIDHYGKCSNEHKSVVAAWNAVGVATAHSGCSILSGPIWGKDVVAQSDMGMGVGVDYYITGPMPPGPPEVPGTINWDVPEGWDVSFNQDNTILTLLDVEDFNSKTLSVTFTPSGGGNSETHSKVVHFISDNESKPGRNLVNIQIDNSQTNQVRFYPNPASSFIKVAIPKNNSTNITLQDVNGRVFVNTITEQSHYDIDLSNLPSGIYILRVTNDKVNFVDKVEIVK